MHKPTSIIKFERCYLGSLIVALANLLLSWTDLQRMPAVRQAAAAIGEWYTPTATAISYAIPLILWYFIARRASVVAKWIVTVFFAFSVISLLATVAVGSFVSTFSAILIVSAVVLNGIAVVMLFKPDAKEWLGEGRDPDDIEAPRV
jgi:hypothetical protein